MELLTFNRKNPLVLMLFTSLVFVTVSVFTLTARAQTSPTSAEQATTKSPRTYTTKAGDKLDRIIQKTMPDSPLKIELLRKAFIEGNPLAFPGGSARQMRKGVVLLIPETQKMLTSFLAPASQEPVAIKKMSGSLSGDFEERRHWVRYP
jgi:Tfp pilus assembly protein FimV